MINFVNPKTGNRLVSRNSGEGEKFFDELTHDEVALVKDSIPRFVDPKDNYAETFGWQFKKWKDTQSVSRGSSVKQKELIMARTHFSEYPIENKAILECGMGGGDDTEVLLTLPFSEVHSFDLSTAVERAKGFLKDPRLVISQASIYEIPYPDNAFDFVFCHRVIMHTPDPEKALRCICKKAKPDGVLFVHSYKRSPERMKEWRYKYRFISTKVPGAFLYFYVRFFGTFMHKVVDYFYKRGGRWQEFAYQYIPFYRVLPSGAYDVPLPELIELEKLITFDALHPKYDLPMTTEDLTRILREEGFVIEYLEDSAPSLVYATARKRELGE